VETTSLATLALWNAIVKPLYSSSRWVTLSFLSIFSNKSDLFHHYTASQAEASFHLNTGLLLIRASLIPVDAHFRWLEVGAGAILLAGGVRQTFQDRLLMAGSCGMVLNEYLKSHSPEEGSWHLGRTGEVPGGAREDTSWF
jgi:hypothetical protein